MRAPTAGSRKYRLWQGGCVLHSDFRRTATRRPSRQNFTRKFFLPLFWASRARICGCVVDVLISAWRCVENDAFASLLSQWEVSTTPLLLRTPPAPVPRSNELRTSGSKKIVTQISVVHSVGDMLPWQAPGESQNCLHYVG